MIVDTLANANRYYSVHPLFKKAFEYINALNLETAEAGKFEIEGKDLHGFVAIKDGVSKGLGKPEAHKNYIDIQLCPVGSETMGWIPLQQSFNPKAEYNAEKDVTFYSDEPQTYFTLTAGWFAIFFPEDVHAVQIGDGPIKKLVVKVKI
jgi:biofilm protein TabA